MNDTNQMVSVPCELLEKALDAAAAVGMQDVADELDRILTPTDEQHQGEPVWFMIASGLSAMHAKAKAISDQQGLDTSSYNVPLYAHPPVDPGEVERLVAANTEYARRHLEQQGEVERRRKELEIAHSDIKVEQRVSHNLRQHKTDYMEAAEETHKALLAKLAEQATLLGRLRAQLNIAKAELRSIMHATDDSQDDGAHHPNAHSLADHALNGIAQIEAALSASAEPSEKACGYSSDDWECMPGGYLYNAKTGEGEEHDSVYICPHCRTKDFLEAAKKAAESTIAGVHLWKSAERDALKANHAEAIKTLAELGPVVARDDETVAICNIDQWYRQHPGYGLQRAPVEPDERAVFEACIRRERPMAPISRKRDLLPKDDPCYGDYCDEPLQRAWIGWQMRATLERMP